MVEPRDKRAPVKIPRRIHHTLGSHVRKHARQTGEIIMFWNLLNDAVFSIWLALMWEAGGASRYQLANVIWNSFQSDKAQREMLREAAKVLFPADESTDKAPRQHEAIVWLIKMIEQLSRHRNDVAHVPIKFVFLDPKKATVSPQSISGRRPSVERLTKQPTASIWRRLRGDLIALSVYAQMIAPHCYRYDSPPPRAIFPPWPRRPLLRCIPIQIQKGSGRSNHRSLEKRQRRLRSLPASP